MNRVLCWMLGVLVLVTVACSGSSDSSTEEQQPTEQSSEELHKKHCILNGVFICPTGEHFNTSVCKCTK